MKIICIGRNYSEHAKELNNPVPDQPVIFSKPETALLKDNKPFYYPEFSNDIHYEAEIVIKINQTGKHIQEHFAHKYFDEISIGLDLTARDIQRECKEKGHPWERAKAFDHSAVIGSFVSKQTFPDLNDINFHLNLNQIRVQEGNTSQMLFSIYRILSEVSKFITLKKGDFIYTGTPAGVGPIKSGDHLEAYVEGKKLLDCKIS